MKVKPGNPFHPQFGKRPDKFIGRDQHIRAFIDSLNDANDPNRVTVVSGIRGSGKTALLSGIKAAIDSKRFAVVDVTAGRGLLQDMLDQLQLQLRPKKRGISGASIGAFGFSLGVQTDTDGGQHSSSSHGFRYYLTLLMEELRSKSRGAVFLIDELPTGRQELDAMREFATCFQHLLRDGFDVALLMAGLPRAASSVLNDKSMTFLHRSTKLFLDDVSILLVRHLFETCFLEAGFGQSRQSLRLAADATKGFPYLIQLIGYYLWKHAGTAVTYKDVEEALVNAKAELFKNVYELMLRELSARDWELLTAMLADPNESIIGDLADRSGKNASDLSKYRARLIEFGLIKATAHGRVSFAPPYLREFLELPGVV
jgi:hypothetical protein